MRALAAGLEFAREQLVFEIGPSRSLIGAEEGKMAPIRRWYDIWMSGGWPIQLHWTIMLANYLKIAVRNLLRRRGYAFINIGGLAVGIACCLLIALYVAHELSYDRHYENVDRTYRVITEYRGAGEGGRGAFSTTPLAETLVREYPEVEEATRIAPEMSEAGSNLVRDLFYDTYTVIGVVEDFHFKSLKNNVEGLSLVLGDFGRTTLVKTRTTDLANTLEDVENIWRGFAPNQPLRYHFLDTRFDQMYASQARAGNLFANFTGLAILIACLGLFGLASFTAKTRTREIGVRKVLGASVTGIVAMLSKDFLRLVVLAFIVAVPVAFIIMQHWLDDFAYRIDLPVWTFALAGLAALGIAMLTVSYQSIKAALADPVKSLRYE